ncbi:hypothetical protein E1B28_006699 [Marasmius oreades]|uniref:F-box domain-containing protein n=1 Tax=Marasmius oreades TaxID=181124 RepID=A0A9P7UWM3_9AGAR|nr:uncharacterized protein E1B28_006699 [Marasmius oreades]KAG7096016.1 hypothetical protein E1B28_006699 [Marasmius oreades]
MERLPNEVFCTVFLFTIFHNPRQGSGAGYNGLADFEITEGQTWPGVFQFSKGPWAISSVCRRWRTIATKFPQLWNRFRLTASDLDPNTDDGGTTALTTWLSFSGTLTLSFFIQPDGICNNPHYSKLFGLLADHADRWEKIELYNSTPAFWSMLHAGDVRSRLGSLTTITVHSGETNVADDAFSGDPTFYQVFLDAPQLRTLVNRNHLPCRGLELPWGQLTEYEGSHRTVVDEHLRLLRLTPNLEKCRLEIAYVASPVSTLPDGQAAAETAVPYNILLPNLQTLQIRTTWFSDSLKHFPVSIRRLRVPALKTLIILTEHLSRVPPPFSAYGEVLRASSSELRSLKLINRPAAGIEDLRAGDILELLRATPALRDLCFTIGATKKSRVLQDTIISRLDISEGGSRNGDGALVPVLETLELRFPSPAAIPMLNLATLAKAIRSRWTPLGPQSSIRSVRFVVELGDVPVDKSILSSAIRGPIMEVLKGEEVDIIIEIGNASVAGW